MECPQTKKGIKIIPVVLVLEIIATIILMLVVNSIWSDYAQEIAGYGFDIQDDEDGLEVSQEIVDDTFDRGDKTQTASMIYFLVEIALALILIYGSYLIYEESKKFGSQHSEKTKWGLAMVGFFGVTVLIQLVAGGAVDRRFWVIWACHPWLWVWCS